MPISHFESAKEETSLSSGPNLFGEVSDVVRKTAQIAEKHPVEASFAGAGVVAMIGFVAGAGVVAMIGFVAATKGKTVHLLITASENLPKRSHDLTLSLVPKEISPLTNSAQSNRASMLTGV